MAEFPAPTISPARVHEPACQLIGHRAYWHRHRYAGGIFYVEHFRQCSFCGCVHPGDLIDLLNGGGRLASTPKAGKFLLFTPNPIAGELVRMGSCPGPVFTKARLPQSLKQRLYGEASAALKFTPTIGERLSGHFERPALEPAPAEIRWPFYAEHTNERQWPDIWAAANHGESNAQVPSA